MHERITALFRRGRFILRLVPAFAAGCILSGLFFTRQGSVAIGELDSRRPASFTPYCGLLRGSHRATWFLYNTLPRAYTGALRNSQEQQKQLDGLRKNLEESGELTGSYETILAERESLLRDLQERLAEMSEIYRKQPALSAKYG